MSRSTDWMRRIAQRVLAALGTLSRSRLPWIYASHRIEEVPAAATHRARLQRGRLRTARWRRRAGKNAGRVQQSRTHTCGSAIATAVVAGHARRLGVARRPCRAAPSRVQIRRGDCWVVHGANGSGKSTLLATMYGEHGVASVGSIWRRDCRRQAAVRVSAARRLRDPGIAGGIAAQADRAGLRGRGAARRVPARWRGSPVRTARRTAGAGRAGRARARAATVWRTVVRSGAARPVCARTGAAA